MRIFNLWLVLFLSQSFIVHAGALVLKPEIRRQLVVVIQFQDYQYEETGGDVDLYAAKISTQMERVRPYIDKVTRGAVHYENDIFDLGVDVFAVDLPINSDRKCTLTPFAKMAKAQIEVKYGVRFDALQGDNEITDFMFLTPGQAICKGTNWSGIADGNTIWLKHHASYIMVHEMGHNFGFDHVGDPGDPLGSGGFISYSSYHLNKKINFDNGRDWFGGCRDCIVDILGNASVTLAPLMTPDLTGSPTLYARIPGLNEMYFLEYRQRVSVDASIPVKLTMGVRVLRKGHQIAVVKPGTTFLVPNTDMAITAHAGADANHIDVDVLRDPLCVYPQGDPVFASGQGTSEKPFVICTIGQFNLLASKPWTRGRHFILGANLDLTGRPIQPIGTPEAPFTGVFNGNHRMLINPPPASNISPDGIFGTIQDAQIFDVVITRR